MAALQSAFVRPAVAKACFRGTPLKKNVAVASRGIKRVTAMKVNKWIKLGVGVAQGAHDGSTRREAHAGSRPQPP